MPGNNTVTKNVAVFWEATSEVKVYTYKLNPPKREIELVTPADEDSIQKAEDSIKNDSSATAFTGPTFATPAKEKPKLQVGDLIQLSGSTAMAVNSAKIEECMGKFDAHHVGIVVGKDRPVHPAAAALTQSQPQLGGGTFGTISSGFGSVALPPPESPPEQLIVACIHNSEMCTIPSNFLKFADGSDLKEPPVVGDVGGLRTCTASSAAKQGASKPAPSAPKCHNNHPLTLATGVPFGMSSVFGGPFGAPGGFGSALLVTCIKCQKRGIEKDSFYYSCPISSCGYNLCMTCGSKPANTTPATATAAGGRGKAPARDVNGPFFAAMK
jgi:hypothetical protein